VQTSPYDENQKNVVNRKNGQGPNHLKFLLLVFSKDEAQAQEAQTQKGQAKKPKPNHEDQG